MVKSTEIKQIIIQAMFAKQPVIENINKPQVQIKLTVIKTKPMSTLVP